MSAADNLHPELFHATHMMFTPGDIIKAVPHARIQEDVRAYATSDIGVAREFASNANKVVLRGTTRRGNPLDETRGQLFGHIYQVEPIDPKEELGTFNEGGLAQVTSRKGFRVKGFVESVPSKGVTGSPQELAEEKRSEEFWKNFRERNTRGRKGSSD